MFGALLCSGVSGLVAAIAPPPIEPAGEARGSTWLVEDSFPVHQKVQVEVVYRVGAGGLQAGDQILVEEAIFHGIRWAKWGYLSTRPAECTGLSDSQEAASVGALVVSGPPGAQLAWSHSVDGPGIHDYGLITVDVESGELVEGDEVSIFLGVDEGTCGLQTARRAFERVPLRVFERLDAADAPALVGEPEFAFLPEEAVSLWVTAPSQAVVGETFVVRSAPVDQHGNVGEGEEVTLTEVVIDREGIHRPTVDWNGQTWSSNPVRVTAEEPERRTYWGDLHTHHGHSYYDDDGAWVDTNHRYARDVAGLDFATESVKAGFHELNAEDLWARQQRSCEQYTDGSYVALLGFEWMGDQGQGHHNVYYSGCEGPLGDDVWQTLVDDVWSFAAEIEAELGYRVVSVPHASSYTGYNWRDIDDTYRPVAEVYSEWGTSMDESESGNVPDGLREGSRLGFLASSDNHDGWLGNGLAWKADFGGLAAVRAEELSGDGLLAALQERSTYATTGERILVDVRVTDASGTHLPGQAWSAAGDATLDWLAAGTGELSRVSVMATSVGATVDSEAVAVWTPGELDAEGSVVLPRSAETLVVWLEVEQADGELAWSSPVWIEPSGTAGGSRGCGGGQALVLVWPLLLLGRRKRVD